MLKLLVYLYIITYDIPLIPYAIFRLRNRWRYCT